MICIFGDVCTNQAVALVLIIEHLTKLNNANSNSLTGIYLLLINKLLRVKLSDW